MRCFSKISKEKDPFAISKGLEEKVKDRSLLIGCAIHVSACSYDEHRTLIMDLLKRAQTKFSEKSGEDYVSPKYKDMLIDFPDPEVGKKLSTRYEVGALVHVYADKVYNRTTYYLAGTTEIILEVATDLIKHAVWGLRRLDIVPNKVLTQHAIVDVGWVEHVCVMPLISGDEARSLASEDTLTHPFVETHAADIARQIGRAMRETLGIDVFYYGLAQQKNIPMMKAWKRRRNLGEQKRARTSVTDEDDNLFVETSLVGAPYEFVEQYIVRMKAVKPRVAHYMSRLLREQDEGLDGVDAYAHPYSLARWEVWCSIEKPFAGGATIEEILDVVKTWNRGNDKVERGYRVGTTQQHCIKVLEKVAKGAKHREKHDLEVLNAFDELLREGLKPLEEDEIHDE